MVILSWLMLLRCSNSHDLRNQFIRLISYLNLVRHFANQIKYLYILVNHVLSELTHEYGCLNRE